MIYDFYPAGFSPDERFIEWTQTIHRKGYALLWVENPEAEPDRRRWTGCCECPCCVSLGQYGLVLDRLVSSDARKLVFGGVFTRRGYIFDTSPITLELNTGTFCFSVRAPKGTDAFEALDVGLRYIMPADPEVIPKRSAAFFLNRLLHYSGSGSFDVTLDPNALRDADKTFFKLPRERFESEICSRAGEPYILEPLDDARLVFSRCALSVCFDKTQEGYAAAQHDLYLSFGGSFKISEGRELLLGLYGMEYMNRCGEIMFCPGCSGFIGANTADGSGQTTSWARFRGDYFSSPESAPLYTPKNGVLSALETPAAEFLDFSPPVPFFPWRNSSVSENLNVTEADDIICRMRTEILGNDIKAAQMRASSILNGSETVAVTPAGLCIGVNGTSWSWLRVAQTSNEPLPNVGISGITPMGKQMLLQRDCFITLTSRREFEEFGCFDLSLDIDGWRIKISDEDFDETIFIIKYCEGCSIRDKLAGNTAFERLWNSAYSKSKEKENYRGFVELVTSAEFEGVVVLNARAFADGSVMQPEVYAAVTLTGEEYLTCVFAAVRRSRISMVGGKLSVMPSPIDALIAYDSDGVTQSGELDYVCKTVGLEAVIEGSRTVKFVSRTEILPKSLIGEQLSEPQCVVLLGRADIQNGVAVYRFMIESEVSYRTLHKPVEAIVISAASMISDNGIVRFTLGGSLSMTKDEECDLFSYDTLSFEGVRIICGNNSAYEDMSNFRLRADRSAAREGSVAETFGAVPEQYIRKSEAASPDDLGFASITAPVRQGEMSTGWNGLIHRVALGDQGSLGAGLPLEFEFISAWNKGEYYFGVRLGGVFKERFSLQNILNIGFRSVSLTQNIKGTPVFKLNALTLKFLGLSVPPKSADLYLFGEGGKIGWYFGYAE